MGLRKKVQAQRICWVRVRQLSAKSKILCQQQIGKAAGDGQGWKRCVPSVLHKDPQLALGSPGQLGR